MARETRVADLVNWHGKLHDLRDAQRCRAPKFLLPFHFVTMALLLKEEGAGAVRISSHMEEYAARLKLWEAIGLVSPTVTSEPETSSRYHEITPLKDEQAVQTSATALADMLTGGGKHGTKEQREDISIMISELLGNCYHHARAHDGLHGLACAQTWYNDTRAQFAIADTGIGIRQSLNESPDLRPHLRKRNACEYACELGVSSKLGRGHAGYGLAIARDIAMQTPNSLLYVQSLNEVYYVENQKEAEIDSLEHALDGTLIVFEWDLKRPLDLAKVYASWPGNDDDDDTEGFF